MFDPAAPDQTPTPESLGWQLCSALPPLALHSVSVHDAQAEVLWLSEGELGEEEVGFAAEALAVLDADRAQTGYDSDLEDGRMAIFLPVRAPGGELLGLVMILADLTSESVLEHLRIPQIRIALRKLALVMRPLPQAEDPGEPAAASAPAPPTRRGLLRARAGNASPRASQPRPEAPFDEEGFEEDPGAAPLEAPSEPPARPSSAGRGASMRRLQAPPEQRRPQARPPSPPRERATAPRTSPSAPGGEPVAPRFSAQRTQGASERGAAPAAPRPARPAARGGRPSFPSFPADPDFPPPPTLPAAQGGTPASRGASRSSRPAAGSGSASPAKPARADAWQQDRGWQEPSAWQEDSSQDRGSRESADPWRGGSTPGSSARQGSGSPQGMTAWPASTTLPGSPTGGSLVLEIVPFVKLRPAVRNRRYEVLPRASQRESSRGPTALETATVQQLASWLGAHRAAWSLEPTSFTLNVSIDTLEDERFLKEASTALKTHSIAPESLGFEIAETLCAQHRAQVERFITSCEQIGCFVAIDDFSFDSAILPLLRSRAVRVVNIDPRLTASARRDKLSEATVVAIIQATRVLGIHNAAKAVDTQISLQWLTTAGCDLAQGPAMAQPQRLDSLG